MTKQEAERQMQAGIIENFVVNPDGRVEIKRTMSEHQPDPSWTSTPRK